MRKAKFSFTRLSMYTGYAFGLGVALMFFWTKDPQDLNMLPFAKLFVDTALISAKIENNKEDKQDTVR